ncbi:hypothetical protein FHU35_14131 [Saccharopolyspora dendranthemae]|uniref:GlsB/YeaQ/YmgE family stress response membrane protein n=1 Tax=Saccharopolyspora dendranthemae TaxID=1181886 RepID=A0A561U3C1_9PSEU|nr:hypothetical protein FHU35_14131 [Saccharopolyspora dendranthemae]
MLMPTFSVTLISLIVVAIVVVTTSAPPGRTLLFGLIGAWAGFAAGALGGVLVDVVTGSGSYLAVVGHGVAVLGAVIGSRRAVTAQADSRS